VYVFATAPPFKVRWLKAQGVRAEHTPNQMATFLISVKIKYRIKFLNDGEKECQTKTYLTG
jgi:hypothetical protein